MNNFTTIDNIALRKLQRRISNGAAVKVYIELCSHCYGNKNQCEPSIDRLTIRTHLSRTTVQRAIKELESKGFISKRKVTGNEYAHNVYTITKFEKQKIKGVKKLEVN